MHVQHRVSLLSAIQNFEMQAMKHGQAESAVVTGREFKNEAKRQKEKNK